MRPAPFALQHLALADLMRHASELPGAPRVGRTMLRRGRWAADSKPLGGVLLDALGADPGPEVARQRHKVDARVRAGACPSLVDYLLVWSDGPPEGGNARQRRRWRRAVRRTLDAWGLDA